MNQDQKKIEILEAEVIRLRYSNAKLVEEKEEAEGKAQCDCWKQAALAGEEVEGR